MLKVRSAYIAAFLTILVLYSCGRIKRKTDNVANTAKAKVLEKKADFRDKLIAHYDSYTPDTRFNKKRFEEFFHFSPPKDVVNLYCHADEMGIDHDYQFGFSCSQETVNRIAENLGLVKADSTDSFSANLWHKFTWWDSARITTLKPYYKTGAHQAYRYLWYDKQKQQAYYFEFDM